MSVLLINLCTIKCDGTDRSPCNRHYEQCTLTGYADDTRREAEALGWTVNVSQASGPARRVRRLDYCPEHRPEWMGPARTYERCGASVEAGFTSPAMTCGFKAGHAKAHLHFDVDHERLFRLDVE